MRSRRAGADVTFGFERSSSFSSSSSSEFFFYYFFLSLFSFVSPHSARKRITEEL